jgi:hypothetical protein
MGRTEDIVEQMHKCYLDWKEENQRYKDKIVASRKFVEKYSWHNVTRNWIALLDKAYEQLGETPRTSVEMV